jgi:hypothetical protein
VAVVGRLHIVVVVGWLLIVDDVVVGRLLIVDAVAVGRLLIVVVVAVGRPLTVETLKLLLLLLLAGEGNIVSVFVVVVGKCGLEGNAWQ